MLVYKGKQYRNLEEQVLQNQQDIQYLLHERGVLNEFGIKVIGIERTAASLPNPESYTGEYGDAYAIGTEPPYTFYIFTREVSGTTGPFWFEIGKFPMPSTIPGPAGPQGESGPQGIRGSRWFITSTSTTPTPSGEYQEGDMVLNPSSGRVWIYGSNGQFTLSGSIQGPTGPTGGIGQTGPQGPIGPAGPQGTQGDPGLPFSIVGELTDTAQLPPPSKAIQNQAYLIGSAANYNLYVISGNDTEGYLWVNVGKVEGVVGPQGPQGQPGAEGPQGPQGAPGHPTYYIPFSFSLTVGISDIIPTSPQADINDFLLFSDGILGRIINIQDFSGRKMATVTQLTSLQGPAGASPTGITITPDTATQGNLTESQWEILQSNDLNYILLNKEIYTLQDKSYESGYYVYVHTGVTNAGTQPVIKNIMVTTSTRSWIMKASNVSTKISAYNVEIPSSASKYVVDICNRYSGGGTTLYHHAVQISGALGSKYSYTVFLDLTLYESVLINTFNSLLTALGSPMGNFHHTAYNAVGTIESQNGIHAIIHGIILDVAEGSMVLNGTMLFPEPLP